MNIRESAQRLLVSIEKENRYSNLALDAELKRGTYKGQERAALTALVYGVTERKIALDYRIAVLAARSPADIALPVLTALRIGLYQLIFAGEKEYAAVHETVALGKNAGERGFLNGVLRAYLRQRDTLENRIAALDGNKGLSVRYSVSMDIVRTLTAGYGREKVGAILAAMEASPPLTLRVNTGKTDRDSCLADLSAAGIAAAPCRYAPDGIRLLVSCPPHSLPGFDEGLFFVQDEASQLCAAAAAPAPGGLFIDTCACPGSKSFSAALLMQNSGRVLSFDRSDAKLPLISAGAARLGLSCLTAACRDARTPEASFAGQADAVLCDVPCSGLGVIAKKPDLRGKDGESMRELPALQYDILCASSGYVREGGKLTYSTCTLNPAENEANVTRFLEEHSDFAPEEFSFDSLSSSGGMLTLFPDTHGCDGFFMSVMRRKDGRR